MAVLWTENPIMFWNDNGTWRKVPDHSRQGLSMESERIGADTRMADGTLRRYQVVKKRTWSTSWERLPSRNSVGSIGVAGGGMTGEEMEAFYNTHDGNFDVRIQAGDGTFETVTVMITEFTKSIVKRGEKADLWDMSVSIKEV